MSAEETHRFFLIEPQLYDALHKQIDDMRGYPKGDTQRALPLREWLRTDENGLVFLSVDKWRITKDDLALIAPHVESGAIIEINRQTWQDAHTSEELTTP